MNGWPDTRPDLPPRQHGWLHDTTRDVLGAVLDEHTRCVVELGSWLGLSTRFICDLAPNAIVYAVDHWRGSAEHQVEPDHPEWQHLIGNLYEQFLASCWEYRARIIPIRADTITGCAELAFRRRVQADVVYVDASHDYASVRADIRCARTLWPRAYIVGDDYDWAGVKQAVDEYGRTVHGIGWRLL